MAMAARFIANVAVTGQSVLNCEGLQSLAMVALMATKARFASSSAVSYQPLAQQYLQSSESEGNGKAGGSYKLSGFLVL